MRYRKDGKLDKRFKEYREHKAKVLAKRRYTEKQDRLKANRKHYRMLKMTLAFVLIAVLIWGYLYVESVQFINKMPESVFISPISHGTVIRQVNAWDKYEGIEAEICDPKYKWNCDLMIAIAKWESSGYACELRPDAENNANSNGTWDSGLLQVNQIHGYDKQELKDADYNISVAYKIWQRQGVHAWSGYLDGGYKECL